MATLADLVNVSGVAGRDEQIGARFDGAADLPRGFGEGASEVRFAVLVPDGFCELVLGDDCEKAQEIARAVSYTHLDVYKRQLAVNDAAAFTALVSQAKAALKPAAA